MMETRAILIISTVVFSCGFFGLLAVRLANPFFKGLGWLAGAFAAGSLGAIAFAVRTHVSSGPPVIVPDTLILLAYVFFHVCILELTESRSFVPRLGIVLLTFQLALYAAIRSSPHAEQLCVVVLGLVLAVQVSQTALLLRRSVKDGMGAPVWFTVSLLLCFAAYNVFRSAVVVVQRIPQDPRLPNPLEVASALVFLGTGLGLGFSGFWMASAQIRVALEGLANSDPLTGIYNRRSFISMCEKERLRSARTGEQFSLIMFDIDHFKRINDLHGHSAGDAILCAVVERLRNSVRNIDIVARWGGEEFVALLPRANSFAALLVAQRLRRSVESMSHAVLSSQSKASAQETFRVTISLGVATYTGTTDTIADLLQQCDTAMYQAKAEGRNRVVATGTPQYALPL